MSSAIGITPAPVAAPRQPKAGVHVISLIDATDTSLGVFTTRNVQYLEELKSIGGDHVTIDAMLDRTTTPAAEKRCQGFAMLGKLCLPLGAGAIAAAGLAFFHLPLALAGACLFAGGAVAAAIGGTKERFQCGIGNYFGSKAQQSFNEPDWNGRRVYHVAPDQASPPPGRFGRLLQRLHLQSRPKPAIDSQVVADKPDVPTRELPEMIDFVQQHLDGDGLNVLWLTGHGMTYKYAGGIPLWAEKQMLVQATKGHGPIGLGVYDSCLGDSLEHLGSIYPHFEYLIMSGEAIKASVLHESLKAAVAKDPARAWTARELGAEMVAHAGPQGKNQWTREGCEMLQLLEASQVPALQEAVGTLGTLLTREIQQGRTAGLVDAVVGTPRYPRIEQLEAMRRQISSGDLKILAERIEKLYGGDTLSMPSKFSFGPFETSPKVRHAGLAQSPHATEIQAAARAVQAAVGKVVVARWAKPEYAADGGISCQLPSSALAVQDRNADNVFYTFDQSDAPPGYRDFVHALTPYMPPER